jgi:predicted transcriptional regulator
MEDKNIQVSIAESKVMEVLWQSSPLTADQIMAEIKEQQDWSFATVKTLLNRLLSKEAIAAEKQGRRYLYSPILMRNDYMNSESQSLLDRLFDGRASALFIHFSKHEKLRPEDIRELKKMIQEMDDDS